MSKDTQHIRSLEGYKSLFETLYPPLCLFANKYLKDMDTAQDIVQEVFIKVWEKNPLYPNQRAIKSYFYTAVRNSCLNHLKSSYHKKRLPATELHLEVLESEDLFLSHLVVMDTYAHLDKAIKQLPNKSQKIIRLSLKDYSVKEIAQELNITKNTVKSQKRIAYNKLRQSLAGLLKAL